MPELMNPESSIILDKGNIVLVPKELRTIYEFKNPVLSEKITYDSDGRVQSEERTIKAESLTVYPLGDSKGPIPLLSEIVVQE